MDFYSKVYRQSNAITFSYGIRATPHWLLVVNIFYDSSLISICPLEFKFIPYEPIFEIIQRVSKVWKRLNILQTIADNIYQLCTVSYGYVTYFSLLLP